MQKIYIINGGKKMWGSEGKLSDYLTKVAEKKLKDLGYEVSSIKIDNGYNVEEEADKIIASDCIIWQFPIWWMAEPWIVKKYIDEVFMEVFGKTGGSDGRHRVNPTANYGHGGNLHIKYMFSTTWNAPAQAFDGKGEFLDGGIDKVLFPMHKAMEFVGMEAFPSFMCNDVIKNPQIDADIERYKKHLEKIFEKE